MTTDLRDKTISLVNTVRNIGSNSDAADYVFSVLQEVQAEAAGEWIAAKDKLPARNEGVVIIWEEDWGQSLGYFHETKWRLAHNEHRDGCSPLFWRPLPQPPVKE